MMKIGRNEPCHCGSGLKYKKCCLGITSSFERELSNINFVLNDEPIHKNGKELLDDVYDYPLSLFDSSNEIKWITKFDNLPPYLQSKIKVILHHRPITISGCYVNSLTLSSYIEGVDIVKGFLGVNEDMSKKIKKIKEIDDGLWICDRKGGLLYNNSFMNKVFGNTKSSKFIYDEKNQVRYIKHLWNKYGDIHFDLGLKTKWRNFDELDWKEYYEGETYQIQNDTDRKFLKFHVDLDIFGIDKNWVLNRGLLSDSILDMVGGGEYKSDIRVPWENEQTQHQKTIFGIK